MYFLYINILVDNENKGRSVYLYGMKSFEMNIIKYSLHFKFMEHWGVHRSTGPQCKHSIDLPVSRTNM